MRPPQERRGRKEFPSRSCPRRSTSSPTRRSRRSGISVWSTLVMCWWRSGTGLRRGRGPRSKELLIPGKKFTSSSTKLELMAVAIGVRVRLFARLREIAGVETMPMKMPAGARLIDVYEGLRVAYPALPPREGVRAVVNQEFTEWEAVVSEGDEVAFIPPVSGGGR